MKKEAGQTLIFILLIMTIALAVGVSISSRTISTVRRTTNVDTSSRALSAAEAGAEFYLAKTNGDLESEITVSNCAPAVTKDYPSATGTLSTDGVRTFAKVGLSRYGCLDSANPKEKYQIKKGGVLEIKLDQTSSPAFTVCWKRPVDPAAVWSQLYTSYYYEDSTGAPQITKIGYKITGDTNTNGSNNFSIVLTLDAAIASYCFTPPLNPSSPKVLRILSLFNSSEVTLKRTTTDIQFQGYKIESTGYVGDSTQAVKRKVTAKRSLPYLPAIFNFEAFSGNGGL